MILAPLEQFQILSLINLNILGTDFSITNFLILSLTTILSFIFVIFFNCAKNFNFLYVPNSWQYLLELSFRLVFQIVSEIFSKKNEKYLPFLIILFHFLLLVDFIAVVYLVNCGDVHYICVYTLFYVTLILVCFYIMFLNFEGLTHTFLVSGLPDNYNGWYNGICYRDGSPVSESKLITDTSVRLTKLEMEHLPSFKKDGTKIHSPQSYFTSTKRNRPWHFYSYIELELTRKNLDVKLIMEQIKLENSRLYGPNFGIRDLDGRSPVSESITETSVHLTKLEMEHLPSFKKDGTKLWSPPAYFILVKTDRPWDFYSYIELELTRKNLDVKLIMEQIKLENSRLYGPNFGISPKIARK